MALFCWIPYSLSFPNTPFPPLPVVFTTTPFLVSQGSWVLFQELSSFDVKGGANPPRTAQSWMISSSKFWVIDTPLKICEKGILCLSLSVSLYQYFFPHGMWLFLWGSLKLSLSPWATSKVLTVVIASPKFICLMGSSRQDTQHQELLCNRWTGEKVALSLAQSPGLIDGSFDSRVAGPSPAEMCLCAGVALSRYCRAVTGTWWHALVWSSMADKLRPSQ